MKKLLSILGTATLFATGTSSMVGITYNTNYSDLKQRSIKVYSEVAAYAMRSAILTDINRINPDWSSSYNYFKKIDDVMPWIVDKKSKINIDSDDNLMTRLYEMTFGMDYFSFKEETKMEVSPNTNLDKYMKQEALDGEIIAPDVNTKNTIGLIGGLLTTVFGSGINGQTMSMILGFLDKDFVKDALVGEETGKIFETINQFLDFQNNPEMQQSMTKIINALTEKEVAINSQTFKEVLQEDTNLLFKALLIFIYQQTIKVENDQEVDYSNVFFNKVAGQDDERLVATSETDTFDGISYVLKFLNSFSRYVAQFDQYRPYAGDFAVPNKLFDPNKTNKEVIDEVLNKKYKPTEDDPTWFKTKTQDGNDVYYSIINLQDFVANLQYYLVPDPKNDPNGINLRKFLLMFFSNGEKEINPISNVIIKNGLGKILSNLLTGFLGDSADRIGNIIKIVIGSDEENFDKIIGDLINWILLKIINNEDLSGIIQTLSLVSGFLPEGDAKTAIKNLVAYKNTARGKAYLAQPFNALYNGQLLPDLLAIIGPAVGDSVDLEKIGKLENFQHMLTMNLADLLETFGVSELPDFVYALHSTSISDFINQIAEPFEIDPSKNGSAYLNHFWNTQDFESIVQQLSSINSGVYNKDDQQMSIILPLYNLILAGTKTLDATNEADKKIIDALQGVSLARQGFAERIVLLEPVEGLENTYKVSKNAINLLLGLNKETMDFIPQTVLYSLSRLYGNNYSQEEYDLNKNLLTEDTKNNFSGHDFDAMFNATTTLIQKVFNQVFIKFTNKSINDLITDEYVVYFKDENFKMSNLVANGFDADQESIPGQTIQFDLTYTDPKTKQEYTYHLFMTKGSYGKWIPDYDGIILPNKEAKRGFIIRKFLRIK